MRKILRHYLSVTPADLVKEGGWPFSILASPTDYVLGLFVDILLPPASLIFVIGFTIAGFFSIPIAIFFFVIIVSVIFRNYRRNLSAYYRWSVISPTPAGQKMREYLAELDQDITDGRKRTTLDFIRLSQSLTALQELWKTANYDLDLVKDY